MVNGEEIHRLICGIVDDRLREILLERGKDFDVGLSISDARVARGLTQAQLGSQCAKYLGSSLTARQIRRYEIGDVDLRRMDVLQTVAAMAKVLEVPLEFAVSSVRKARDATQQKAS